MSQKFSSEANIPIKFSIVGVAIGHLECFRVSVLIVDSFSKQICLMCLTSASSVVLAQYVDDVREVSYDLVNLGLARLLDAGCEFRFELVRIRSQFVHFCYVLCCSRCSCFVFLLLFSGSC